MAKRLANHPKCTIMWHTEATECLGDGDLLNALSIVNNQTKETSKLEVNGLFYAIGHVPAVELIKDQVHTDEDGYIVTIPGTAQTSVHGVFAAGDVQVRSFRQTAAVDALTDPESGRNVLLSGQTLPPSYHVGRHRLHGSPCVFHQRSSSSSRYLVADDVVLLLPCYAVEAERLIAEEEEGVELTDDKTGARA
jgi:hypothetical protein